MQSVLAKQSLCRTSALGGHWCKCNDRGRLTKLHNSCGAAIVPVAVLPNDRRFWDTAMGEGFSDWYLKSGIESAREPERDPDRPPGTQLEFAWH